MGAEGLGFRANEPPGLAGVDEVRLWSNGFGCDGLVPCSHRCAHVFSARFFGPAHVLARPYRRLFGEERTSWNTCSDSC